MTDFYSALHLSRESDVEELQQTLAELLKQTRSDLMSADDEQKSEKAKETILLAREAMKRFADQETKQAYDKQLEAEQREAISRRIRENSRYGSDDELLESLKNAVEKEDFAEIGSLAREFHLRNCETAEYYRYMAESYAKQHDMKKAWETAQQITELLGEEAAIQKAEACAAIAEVGLNNDEETAIVHKVIEYALQYDDELYGNAGNQDILMDLKNGNEALAIQKVQKTMAKHPEWEVFRVKALLHLYVYAKKRYTQNDEDGSSHYNSMSNYENHLKLMQLLVRLCPKKDEKVYSALSNELEEIEAMSGKSILPDAWWPIGYTLVFGLCSLVQPAIRIVSIILLALAVLFFVTLRIPKCLMYRYRKTKQVDGAVQFVRLFAKAVELIFDVFGGWAFKLMVKHLR